VAFHHTEMMIESLKYSVVALEVVKTNENGCGEMHPWRYTRIFDVMTARHARRISDNSVCFFSHEIAHEKSVTSMGKSDETKKDSVSVIPSFLVLKAFAPWGVFFFSGADYSMWA
jgi:hypothetical protein